jgi:REP element-mobilizing transposase RayT
MLDQPPINNKNTPRPSRKSLRLAEYDYSTAGYYFVTICIREQQCLLGEIVADAVCLNSAGQMIASAWMALPERFEQVGLDSFVVMRSFYDHVIRNDQDLSRIQEYILNNPLQWALDDENPDRKYRPTLGGHKVHPYEQSNSSLHAKH